MIKHPPHLQILLIIGTKLIERTTSHLVKVFGTMTYTIRNKKYKELVTYSLFHL